MKPVTLPHSHYASGWKTEGVVRTLDEINDLGRRYAGLPDSEEKQNALLEICQCFHPYLMKYLVMICRGRVPIAGHGSNPAYVNKDVKPFLIYFLPKGEKPTSPNLSKVTRHLHLAFKDMETEEIYDVLMEQLVGTVKGYDPDYKAKVKLVVDTINHELPKRKQFSIADVNRYLAVDSTRYIRLLVRVGFLQKAQDGLSRTASWPPPASFFGGSPIGLAYYIQKWFRFGLQDWVSRRMRELESKEGVYSLEGWCEMQEEWSDDSDRIRKPMDTADQSGVTAPNEDMMNKPLDISQLNIEWVQGTKDAIFGGLSKNDRYLLYMVYARGMEMAEVATALGCGPREARQRLTDVLAAVRLQAEAA